MRESVIYQDIWQRSALSLISRQLNRQLGEVDTSLTEQIQRLSTEQLEALGEALLGFSEAADLATWLEQQERS